MGRLPYHDPSTLPKIDGVDLALLPPDYEPGSRERSIPSRILARLVGEQAQYVATLWRSFSAAEQMRCHLPRYGLRFLATQFLFEAAIRPARGRGRGAPRLRSRLRRHRRGARYSSGSGGLRSRARRTVRSVFL